MPQELEKVTAYDGPLLEVGAKLSLDQIAMHRLVAHNTDRGNVHAMGVGAQLGLPTLEAPLIMTVDEDTNDGEGSGGMGADKEGDSADSSAQA